MKNRKLKLIKISAIAASCVIAVVTALLLIVKLEMERWSDFEYYETFSTTDKAHDIVLYISYPPLPPNNRLKFKMICKDNSSGKEVKQEEFSFSVPQNEDWFTMKEDASQKCDFILHHSYGDEKIELVWGDIFP